MALLLFPTGFVPKLLSLKNFHYLYVINFKTNKMKFLNQWYPIIIAFIAMCYSIGLGLFGHTEEAQYSAHWAGTILLFAIAIRQRRGR